MARFTSFVVLMFTLAASPAPAQWVFKPHTFRVSEVPAGAAADAPSSSVVVGQEGHFVAFLSRASNLGGSDPLGWQDVFHLDREHGILRNISRGSNGLLANADSMQPAITPDGQRVVFASTATNLIGGMDSGSDVFLWSATSSGASLVQVIGAGDPDGDCHHPDISDDYSRIVFETTASNVARPDLNGLSDIVMVTGLLSATRVSVALSGEPDGPSNEPAIAGDGSAVAFSSRATNLVAADTNNQRDVFVKPTGGSMERVSVATDGSQANDLSQCPDLSADGRYVVFESKARNFFIPDLNFASDIFRHDRQTGTTIHISRSTTGEPGNAGSYHPSISADGDIIAFHSDATNLVPLDTNGTSDVFLHQVSTGVTIRSSVYGLNTQASGDSTQPSLSPDGNFIGFESTASDLIFSDWNFVPDAFLRGRILTFDPGNPVLREFMPFEFTCYPGVPSGPVLLFVVAVNGAPFLSHVASGKFDRFGVWSLRGDTPGGLGTADLQLQMFGLAQNGKFEGSGVASVQLR